MDWGSVADWVSGLGSIAASIIALYLAGSERRAQRERERPEISVEVGKVEDDGWSIVTLNILNPAHKEWQLLKVDVLHPKSALITTQEDTLIYTKPWDAKFSAERRNDLASRSKSLRRIIRSVGTMNSTATGSLPANRIWERLPIFFGNNPTDLVLKLHFSSLEPKPDQFSVRIFRTIE